MRQKTMIKKIILNLFILSINSCKAMLPKKTGLSLPNIKPTAPQQIASEEDDPYYSSFLNRRCNSSSCSLQNIEQTAPQEAEKKTVKKALHEQSNNTAMKPFKIAGSDRKTACNFAERQPDQVNKEKKEKTDNTNMARLNLPNIKETAPQEAAEQTANLNSEHDSNGFSRSFNQYFVEANGSYKKHEEQTNDVNGQSNNTAIKCSGEKTACSSAKMHTDQVNKEKKEKKFNRKLVLEHIKTKISILNEEIHLVFQECLFFQYEVLKIKLSISFNSQNLEAKIKEKKQIENAIDYYIEEKNKIKREISNVTFLIEKIKKTKQKQYIVNKQNYRLCLKLLEEDTDIFEEIIQKLNKKYDKILLSPCLLDFDFQNSVLKKELEEKNKKLYELQNKLRRWTGNLHSLHRKLFRMNKSVYDCDKKMVEMVQKLKQANELLK